jgi:hypothetical protein
MRKHELNNAQTIIEKRETEIIRRTSAPRPKAKNVLCTKTELQVTLTNGLIIATPLSQFPRLQKGTLKERNQREFIADGMGIHWEALDEDISVKGLLYSLVNRLPKGSFDLLETGKTRRPVISRINVPA